MRAAVHGARISSSLESFCKQTTQSCPDTPRRCEGTFCTLGLFNLATIKEIAFDLWKNHVLFFDLPSDYCCVTHCVHEKDGWLGQNTQFIVSLSTHLQG